ncbi:MAG: carboxypeptidase-like regulatory domain-containing protein [Bacteroidetes bacterium]|nr:carboxypeptidase-like regulatory domain-containing protein [Bacteroidota bacterium]
MKQNLRIAIYPSVIKTKPSSIRKLFSIWIALAMMGPVAMAQTRVITGIVMDSSSHAPLANVTVCAQHTTHCVLSGSDGRFKITVEQVVKKVQLTATGYHAGFISLKDSATAEEVVMLSKSFEELQQVTVNGRKKGRYRNKGNPAVELIRQVIENKEKNGPGADPYSAYRQYEKTRVLMDRPPKFITKGGPLKKFKYFFDNIDSTTIPGRKLSAIYLQEIVSDNYYRKSPEKNKQVVIGKKMVDFGEHVDMHGLNDALNRLYENINIYDNNIDAFTTQFLSPIADAGPTFYKYFIEDTVLEKGVKLVKLNFMPRNPEDALFEGTLYITLDGHFAVCKLEMSVNKNTNLNWVRNIKIIQDFELGAQARYHLASSDVVAFFSPFTKSNGLFGERLRIISNLTKDPIADSVFKGRGNDTLSMAAHQPEKFWQEDRALTLTKTESAVYKNADSLLKMRSYHRLMDWATLLAVGYKSWGIFDIGQVGNFYSYNPVEGSRFRFGGRTNTKLSKSVFAESYLAYGLKDQQWKYFLSGSYALNHKSIYTFPIHYVQASYMHDTKNPGQEDVFAQGNALFSSLTRGYNSNLLYNDIFRLSYVKELENHLSYSIGMKYWKQQPSDSLHYVYKLSQNLYDTAHQLTVSEISATFRWAPHEQFFQNKIARRNIVNKYPIISLDLAKGFRGVAGGQYNYDALHIDLFKRFYLSQLGFTDIDVSAAYLGGNLPFPLLFIAPANQTFFYSYYANNLMNTEEFVSDHYAGININHYFNGFFLNKIPLLKKLRLREVVEAKILYGGLRDENNPAKNPSQMLFPLVNGSLVTYNLGQQPYIEAGIGIYNIFSVIRVDLIKRFTYLDNPRISSLGLRFSTNFNF